MEIRIRPLTPPAFYRRVPELVDIYLEAMHYPTTLRSERIHAWRALTSSASFRAVIAHDTQDCTLGVSFGYSAIRTRWFHTHICHSVRALYGQHSPFEAVLHHYFELAELHVTPAFQGHGIGRCLATHLLEMCSEPFTILTTPEIQAPHCGSPAAFALYRSLGFEDLVRSLRFPGDPREFAVLFRHNL